MIFTTPNLKYEDYQVNITYLGTHFIILLNSFKSKILVYRSFLTLVFEFAVVIFEFLIFEQKQKKFWNHYWDLKFETFWQNYDTALEWNKKIKIRRWIYMNRKSFLTRHLTYHKEWGFSNNRIKYLWKFE